MGKLADEWSGDRVAWFVNRHKASRSSRPQAHGLGADREALAMDACSQATALRGASAVARDENSGCELERYYRGEDGSIRILW